SSRMTMDAASAPGRARSLRRYRPWFYAAAAYNLGWGSLVVLSPTLLFRVLDVEAPSVLPLWQVVGMFVLAYAPAYWWAGRLPERHVHLVLTGHLGKVGIVTLTDWRSERAIA
ncbi:MAG TPA: hypothetical protein VGW38_12265, partial [Chloroflexota bacterium]|nr:hypothetical protein [Chloroflexota bacterium]